MRQSRSNPAFQHVLNSVTHPIALTAVALLWLNAMVLQPRWPSGFTGKAGDAAWMVLAPLLVAAGLAWLVPAGWRRQVQLVGWLAAGLCGAALILVKTVPAVNAGVVELFRAQLDYPLKLALDPSDVLVLPALALFGWLWARPPAPRPHRTWPGLAALGLAALAVMADSAAPQNLGITCLRETDTALLAFKEQIYTPEFGNRQHQVVVFQSGDGGLTWQQVATGNYDADKPPTAAPNGGNAPLLQFGQCATHEGDWQLADPANAQVLYAFVGNRGIYRSDDAGQTLKKEADLANTSVLNALFTPKTGNLLAAVGRQGVLVRQPDGKWQAVLADQVSGP